MSTPRKTKYGVYINDFYPEHKEIAEQFECVFCKIVSINNYYLNCIHCICEDCIINGIEYEKCPKDNIDIIKDINSFKNPLLGDVVLNKLKIKCRFNNEGCKWCGFFGDFEKHLENCLIFNNKDIAISIIKNNILNNNKSKKENLSIFINENFGIINNQKNNLLNKKRNNNEIENNINDKDDNNEFSLFSNLEKNINLNENHFLSFYQNIETYNKEMILSEESDDFDSINSSNSSSSENFENMNNKILIDPNLTLNIFPYHYYFTEPLYNSFSCLIKTKSRNILADNKKISFGLTNINNNNYIEILNNIKYESLFFKDDLIRISYDNNLFLIYFENNKKNYIKIPFINEENIRLYPTIVLNNKLDILEVSHD